MSDKFDKTDLAWQAFRYIAHEMNAEEIAAFEELLATDQEAREEVARAVELSQAVAALPQEVSLPQPAAPWAHRLTWMLVGTAACLLVVGAIELMRKTDAPLASQPTELNHSLAAAWVVSQQVAEEISSLPIEEADATAAEETATQETEESDDMAVPEWLLAAVSGQQAAPPAQQP